MNRLGQLAFFFGSDWFSQVIETKHIVQKIPSILALMPIRDKFTAHRQQDFPRNDDCLSLGFNEFGLAPGLLGSIKNPGSVVIQFQFPTKKRHPFLVKYNSPSVSSIECINSKNNLIIFTPTMLHQRILNETVSLLEYFFSFQL